MGLLLPEEAGNVASAPATEGNTAAEDDDDDNTKAGTPAQAVDTIVAD